MTLAPMLTLF